MITLKEGLKTGLVILELLRDDERLKNIPIYVECFINCREGGLTFTVKGQTKSMTYCIYEHRNSDNIIVNGKENWSSFSDDLPYAGEDKWDCIKSFGYGKYFECFQWLSNEFVRKFEEMKDDS